MTHGAEGPISRDGQTFDRSFINRFSLAVCVGGGRSSDMEEDNLPV